MEQTANLIGIMGAIFKIVALVAAFTLPIWGYSLIEKNFICKHQALKANRGGLGATSIVASIGTTTAGVFLIQSLPLVFGIINDVAGSFAVNTVYSDHMFGSGVGDYVDQFYGLTAQLGDITQTAAPMAAVGLGGYNLLNNISRGLPATLTK